MTDNIDVVKNFIKISYDETEKQRKLAICCNYQYTFKAKSKGKIFGTELHTSIRWTCKDRVCGATITTESDVVTKISGQPIESPTAEMIKASHFSHDPKEDLDLKAYAAGTQMRKRARNVETIGHIHLEVENAFLQAHVDDGTTDEERSQHYDEAAVKFPQCLNIHASLYRAQAQCYI
jgi:hypothetical protein